MSKIPPICTLIPLNRDRAAQTNYEFLIREFVVFPIIIKVSSFLLFLPFFLHNFGLSSFNEGSSPKNE